MTRVLVTGLLAVAATGCGERTGTAPAGGEGEHVATVGEPESRVEGAESRAVPAESRTGRVAADGSPAGRLGARAELEADPRATDANGTLSATGASTVPSSFPDASNTGVPAGTSLRTTGSLTVSTDGKVLSGLHIKGCLTVTARNVIVRKSRITCSGRYSIRTINAKNLLVEDVEIDGRGVNSAAVCCSDYTLRRVDISNVIDGPRLADNTTVEASWIHHLTRVSGSHNDTLQTTGGSNILVRGNRLEAYNPSTNDPFNACLMIGSTTAPMVSNLRYEQNYCNGGNYSIGVRTDLKAKDVVFRSNAFGRDYRYGVVARPNQAGITWDRLTNVWLDNGTPVVR